MKTHQLFNRALSMFDRVLSNATMSNTTNRVLLALVLLAAGFVLFYGLNFPSVRMWDESRLAVNALEMLDNRQWFVTYYDSKPDMWNTKPPFMIWLIVFCMSFFGTNTWALRLPSAIAGLATVGVLLFFCTRHLKAFNAGLLSVVVLITSTAYVGEHVTRTGDYDAMMVLWITIYSLALFVHFNHLVFKQQHQVSSLWIAGVAFVLAVWTKGIAGVLGLPGLFLYIAIQPRLAVKLFRNAHTYYVIAFCLLFSLLPYLIREWQNPGYVAAVLENEIFGRYNSTVEQNAGPVYFYIVALLKRYPVWVVLLIPCSIVNLISKNILFKAYGKFSLLYLTSFLLIISLAKTKLPWYDAPIYPIAAVSIGLGICELYGIFRRWHDRQNPRSPFARRTKIAAVLFVTLLFCIPSGYIAHKRIYRNYGTSYDWRKFEEPELHYGDYFQEISLAQPSLKEFVVPINSDEDNAHLLFHTDEYNAHLFFYTKVYNREGYNIRLEKYNLDRLSQEDRLSQNTVVTCDQAIQSEITQSQKFNLLHSNGYCSTFTIQ